jgi:hypothetical protein
MQNFAAHRLGNIIIIVITGAITIGCFVAAALMLIHPGERDRRHPKHQVLNDD